MQKKSIEIFVTLLENIVQEASTSMDLVRKLPNSDILIKYMHTHLGLAHDQEYDEVKKISWNDIKIRSRWGSNDKQNWVLVRGKNGVGAISSTERYHALAVDEIGEIVEKTSDRGGTVLDWLKDYIGPIQSFYVGKASGAVKKKKIERKKQKPLPVEQYTDIDTFSMILMKKFKPLWVRAVEAAQADIKGFVGTQIKNSSYEKAGKKLNRLQALDQILKALEDGKDPTSSQDGYNDTYSAPFSAMKLALHNAILLTAHHYYPDLTGGFTDRARSYGRSSTHSLNNQSAVEHLFNDIRGGDTSKLGTLLAFFKKGLISG